jgi:hypothetical protein
VSLGTAGTQSLSVTDTADASVTGSASVEVEADAVTELELAAPGMVTVGLPFSVEVRARDGFGNVNPSYGGTVRFLSTDALARLPPDYTFTPSDAGVRDFDDLSLLSVGVQGLVVLDTADPAIVGGASVTVSASGPATSFFTVTPCRAVDTRDAALGGPNPLGAGTDTSFTLGGGACGIPLSAKAVSLNVTVTQPTAAGNLRLYPAGIPLPEVSTLNYGAGQTRANNAIVSLGASGQLVVRCSQASGAAHVIIDVSGYFE